ncbi:MAG TPA: DUF4440 domain-containing protein [Vicinamibacterales bacterium]|nr:DUF4440 domain-containing protein [Vicinamibacterales bacterium]
MKHLIPLLAALFVPAFVIAQTPTPQHIADELLAADRAFSAAAVKSDLMTGLGSMFADDVAMMAPSAIAYGRQKAVEVLKANPANLGATAEWTPARVGISGDGKHGFTAGWMQITRADGTVNPAKYLAYWEKQADGWRVLVYKRAPATTLPPPTPPTYLLPKQITPSAADTTAIERSRQSLAQAEQSFSDEAQMIGIGPAFTKYGSAEAINLGGPDAVAFTYGNDAIGAAVSGGDMSPTSPVYWGPEKTIVSASGDFGVTMGYINQHKPGADGKPAPPQAFFTIWRRDGPSAPWRYVAE